MPGMAHEWRKWCSSLLLRLFRVDILTLNTLTVVLRAAGMRVDSDAGYEARHERRSTLFRLLCRHVPRVQSKEVGGIRRIGSVRNFVCEAFF